MLTRKLKSAIVACRDFLAKERFTPLQFVSIITAFVATLTFLVCLSSCSKDDDPANDNDRNGQPYKFRIEAIEQYPDSCGVGIVLGFYRYNDETGLPRTEWLVPDDQDPVYYVSPHTWEYEVPRNFTGFYINVGNGFTSEQIKNFDIWMSGVEYRSETTLKVYVNDKLIFSQTKWALAFGWNIGYNSTTKKYVYKDGNGNTVEVSTL